MRYLVQDDLAQAGRAEGLIDAWDAANPGFVGTVVVVELCWVLSAVYGLPRPHLVAVVERLLDLPQVRLQDPHLIRRALALARQGADIADAVIAETAASAGCTATMTFDRGAAQHAGMTLL